MDLMEAFDTLNEGNIRGMREREQEIKEYISKVFLKNVSDPAVQTVLRRVLFYDKNLIDWDDFLEQIKEQMPETLTEM